MRPGESRGLTPDRRDVRVGLTTGSNVYTDFLVFLPTLLRDDPAASTNLTRNGAQNQGPGNAVSP